MAYGLIVSEKAERFLKKQDRQHQIRIRDKLRALQKNPRLGKPLVDQMVGFWSLRAGKYRVRYTIEEQRLVVLVIDINHRKKAYRS